MEEIILAQLLENDKFARKVIPYLTPDLFYGETEQTLFKLIEKYLIKYNDLPTKEVLYTEASELGTLNEHTFKEIMSLIQGLETNPATKIDWLLDQTETFIQDRNVHNAIRKSIQILDSPGDLTKDAIPKLLTDALAISFDTNIGHDFIASADERFEMYHSTQTRIPFDLFYLNRITGGGTPRKTLNLIIAPTGVGKSMAMCSMASANLLDNRNVLYITLEMAEERIAERVDANLLDVTLDDLMELSKDDYIRRIQRLKDTTTGRLIIKEYPTASAGAGHFRHLLNELKIKKNFVPEIIYIDYINLCTSTRIRGNMAVNSYTYIKAIAEELRGLAVEFNLPIWTATQTNRDGINSSDIDLNDTSDSIGLPMTVDFMIALIATPELDDMGQMMMKQLKNRYGDIAQNRCFVINVNKSKMRLSDAPIVDQINIMDGPIMDSTDFGQQDSSRGKKFDKEKFGGFK